MFPKFLGGDGKMRKRLNLLQNTNEIRYRYRTASKKERGEILRTFCELTGYNRKHAGRVLRGRVKRKEQSRKRGRRSHYGYDEFMEALKRLWLATDQMCGHNLKIAIPIWLPHYEVEYGPVSEKAREDLFKVSDSTIDRLLKARRAEHPKGRCGTRPGTLLRTQIPIRTDFWDVDRPGYLEGDTVEHCGGPTAGIYVCSLTLTDIDSEWTCSRAMWGKRGKEVRDQFERVEQIIPFEVCGFDADNGGEFINYELVKFFSDRPKFIPFTRSRAYKKNDNAHVEQKNYMHVRQLLGYERLDKPELVPLINDLYENAWDLYKNFFCPTMKLKAKERIGSKIRKIYYPSHTPYQRLLASPHVTEEKKNELRAVYASLNPFELKRQIQKKLRVIFQLLHQPHIEARVS
jgi:hypothetical protein